MSNAFLTSRQRARSCTLALVLGAAPMGAFAQVNYNSQEDVYAQDFNSLPSTGSSFTWLDNATIPGWFAHNSVGVSFNPAGITTGSTTTGDLYSFGSNTSTDRALGSISSGTVGDLMWGVQFVNNTGTIITGFSLGYTGEQWRRASAAEQALSVEFSLAATSLASGDYFTIQGLGFVSPDTAGSTGARDGNASAYRTVIGPATINNINWTPGTSLWIRFLDPDHSGSDHGLAIDDFTFTAADASPNYAPPTGYYAAAQGLTGEPLAAALANIIAPHTVLALDLGAWDAIETLDEDPVDPDYVTLTYTDGSILKTDTTWTLESLWPASRGIDVTGPDATDLFNLRAVLAAVTTARADRIFDLSDPQDVGFASPAHSDAAPGTSADTDSWQPAPDERGDIARALFYMDVRYNGLEAATTDLVLENQIGTTADMAVLTTLLQWHHDDPVSEAERLRNHRIFTLYQHNRNPFIDRPEFADLIFGDFVEQSQDLDLDGLPGYWEALHAFDPEDPTDASTDADSDGFSNFEEYWMGSDPHSASSPPALIVDAAHTGSVQDGTAAYPFKTIQGAVNAVPDTQLRAILVKPGTYLGPYIDDKQHIHLFSEQGPEVTIIEANPTNSSVVRLYDFDRASFVGFTVRDADTTWFGAGLRIDSPNGEILVANNIVTNNVTTNTSSGGGGIYLKAGAGSRLVNNIIFGNSAKRGGGVLFAGGNADFWHNTIVGNTATAGNGGGLSAIQGVTPDIRNNIIWQNVGSAPNAQLHQLPTATSNLIQDAASGSGNLSSDPLFIDAPNSDYHLQSTSPARNAATPVPLANDFEFDPRPDTASSLPDLGADEVVIADPNGDSDEDDLPNQWELQHNLDPNNGDENNNGIPDGLDDFDGDGVSNYQEYLDGTDPLDAGSGLSPPIASVDAGNTNELLIFTPLSP